MAWWFGRKAAEPVRPFVPAWLTGDAETSGFVRGYQAQLDEVYRRNPVGLRAVRLVAGLVGGLPLFAEEGSAHAVDLVRGAGLLERAAAALLLHGNAYVRLAVDGHDRPAELHCLRPERVSMVCGADGWPSAYLYRAGGQVVRIAKEDALGRQQVAHMKALNPGDDHSDPDRDYQAGQARASSGRGGTRETRVELPAVLAAGEARQLVEQALARRWLAGDTMKWRLPPARMGLRPGDALQLAGMPRPWMVRTVSIEGMAVAIEAEAAPVAIQSLPADPGRPVSEPDLPVGRSEVALFELPPEADALGDSPIAYIAASNEGQWKSLPIELTLGDQPLPGLAIGRRSIVGRTETVLDPRTPHIIDQRSQVVIRLANSEDILLNADQDALTAGANLAMIGVELVQFGRAEALGPGLFRLSNLLRGRRGTEWAAATHQAGEPFCMMDPGRVRSAPLAAGAVGAMLTAVAHGIGDVAPLPQASRSVSGEAMRPPPPCHLKAIRSGADILVQWVRRSHRQWAWVDSVGDGEDGFPERYRLTVEGPGGEAVVETSSRSVLLGVSQIPGQAGQSITLSVVTLGPAALSHAARTTFTL